MSFWKFGFAPAPSSVESLLNSFFAPPSSSSVAVAADLSARTLDLLLACPDLLSEVKSGSNARLLDFLARAEVVQRLGGWIVWGLGGDAMGNVLNGGILADDVEDGPVPEINVAASEGKSSGMGGVPRRMNLNALGEFVGGDVEQSLELASAPFPRLAAEILASDAPSLAEILFDPLTTRAHSATSPSPTAFLVPFWEALLRSSELQLETRSVQVGYWARVNGVLLSGPHGQQALPIILSIPSLLPRLLLLLPFCSPLNDLLLLLLRLSPPSSHLTTTLVPQALRMLDPDAPLGADGHIAADELLRGVIELCSATPLPLPPPPITTASLQTQQEEQETWRENGLARQLADAKSVRTLVDWMLGGLEVSEDVDTPRLPSKDTPAVVDNSSELRTSSLVRSISVLVDLIRKNNSDFVEQQMLLWARRREAIQMERELLEAEGAELVDGLPPLPLALDRGPCLVDLGAMLAVITERLGGFQSLMQNPRSFRGPLSTTAGMIVPLTLERYRICEFYAELLHCSNMSLLNRPLAADPLYDSEGYLQRGWLAADDLAEALATGSLEEESFSRPPHSPPTSYSPFPLPTSPVEMSMNSGASTPSGAGSLDSESGILTRVEAKALRDMLASSGASNPFDDPDDEDGEEELTAATEAINLDGDLHSRESTATMPPSNGARKSWDEPPHRPGRVAPLVTPPPGQLLKKKFIEHRVIETLLDLFFEFPWNNFMHNVVFDVLQQIFHGRIDRALDRQLALSVFIDGRLVDRILAGQAANDIEVAKPRGIRLGYMGHMTLVAEEIVKVFALYPTEILSVVRPHLPQPAWDRYVATTLRETRDRDLAPLGGGASPAGIHDAGSISTSGSGSGLSDEDDEFPTASAKGRERSMRAVGEAGVGGDAAAKSGDAENVSSDQFSRYLASAISSDRADKFGSSDEDEDDDAAPAWLGGSRFDPSDVDFSLSEASASMPSKKIQFGFEDRFDTVGKGVFRRSESPESDEEDADWGPFAADSTSPTTARDAFDDFKPTVQSSFPVAFPTTFASDAFDATPSDGFDSSFGSDNFTSVQGDDGDDDDFGDFEGALSSPPTTNRLSLNPDPLALDDFDFTEESRTVFSTPPPPPLESSFGTSPTSPSRLSRATSSTPTHVPPRSSFSSSPSNSSLTSPSILADLATSDQAELGPSMHAFAHLTDDGMVEATVDGVIVKVPADEITLAHNRRTSLDGNR